MPRDLEIICLNSSRKDPAKRYESASALADDLNRFIRGDAIAARPVSRIYRARKWVWRHPVRAVTAAGIILVAIASTSTGLWLHWQKMETARSVNQDLQEVVRCEQASNWREARVAFERAKGRLGNSGTADIRRRLQVIGQDLDLADRLAVIRFNRAAAIRTTFNTNEVDEEYREAFKKAGLGTIDETPATVANRIATSPVRHAIVATLDDWTFCVDDFDRRTWLLEIARRADPDPSWRDKVRDLKNWRNAKTLAELAQKPTLENESAALLLVLGGPLEYAHEDSVTFFRRVQRAHPSDFWSNYVLAEALDEKKSPDSIGFYRAAIAIRPDALAPHVNLGAALLKQGREDEGLVYFQQASQLQPRSAAVHFILAYALLSRGKSERALQVAQEAVRIEPTSGDAHLVLSQANLEQGRFAEAMTTSRRATELLPQKSKQHAYALRVIGICEQMIALEKRLPAILKEEAEPANAMEYFQFADLLTRMRRYDLASRLCVEGLAASPEMAADLVQNNRYKAAGCAALAGYETEKSDVPPDERARWRKQAREWLLADIAGWYKQLEQNDPSIRGVALARFQSWRTNRNLASIRDADCLSTLSSAEWADCLAIWKKVDALLDRIGGPKADLR